MRICFIAAGEFWFIDPYLEYFKACGHEVHFISLSPSPERIAPVYNTGFGKKYTAWEGKWKYPLSILRIRRLIKKLRPDIVHAHYATSGGLASLFCGSHPIVVTAHGSDLIVRTKSRIWRPLLKAIFNNADCVNTVSEDLKNIALSLGVRPDKIEVFTLGIDTKLFSFIERPLISKDRPLRLVCTRRLEQVYDHSTIIKALSVLQRKDIAFKMTFVGGGSLMEQLKQQVKDEQLMDQVTFLGWRNTNQLPKILHEHDVYLSTSLWDGLSLSLLEAMATGLFPIVSDIRANSALLENRVDCFLHKVGDADALANCIMQLLENPEIAKSAAQRNRDYVVEKGDRNKNMKRLASIYEELILQTRKTKT